MWRSEPTGIKEGLGVLEAVTWPLLALRLALPRPVLISVLKYTGPFITYFIVEIHVLHLKFRCIY